MSGFLLVDIFGYAQEGKDLNPNIAYLDANVELLFYSSPHIFLWSLLAKPKLFGIRYYFAIYDRVFSNFSSTRALYNKESEYFVR